MVVLNYCNLYWDFKFVVKRQSKMACGFFVESALGTDQTKLVILSYI